MLTQDSRRAGPQGLFFFLFHLDGFEIFGLEDLAAVETLDIVDAIATGNHLGTGVIAGNHNSACDEAYSIRAHASVKPPLGHTLDRGGPERPALQSG
jgi:hypothetical protein